MWKVYNLKTTSRCVKCENDHRRRLMGWTKTLASPRVQGSPAAFKVKYFGSQHNMETLYLVILPQETQVEYQLTLMIGYTSPKKVWKIKKDTPYSAIRQLPPSIFCYSDSEGVMIGRNIALRKTLNSIETTAAATVACPVTRGVE